jgi:hypothetical protein
MGADLLRNQGEISNDVTHRIERDLDLEDSRLQIQVGLFCPRGPGYQGRGVAGGVVREDPA